MSTETVPKGYKRTEVGVIPVEWRDPTVRLLAANRPNAIVGGPFGSDLVSKDYVAAGVPVVRGQNMGGPYVSGDFAFVSIAKAKSLQANIARPDDILFTQRGTLGQVSIIPFGSFSEYIVSQSQMKLTLDDTAAVPKYVYHYFNSTAGCRQILDSAIQTGVPHTNLGILRSYTIPLPPLAEQQAIAAALSDADALIESLEQLIAKKRQIKQGAMQELLTGKRRLPGFTGKWDVVSLGQLGKCIRGVSYNPDQDLEANDTDKTYRLLRSNNVQGSMIRFENMQYVDRSRVSSDQILCNGDILICMANGSKDLVGKSGVFHDQEGERYTFGAFMGAFRANSGESRYAFLLLQSNAFRKHVGVLLAGSSINNLTPTSVESFEMNSPSELDERNAIASVLSDMDTELEALEGKLDKARQVKQGMMQQLLTGKVRLV